MISPTEKRRRLRQLLAGPDIFPAIACCDVSDDQERVERVAACLAAGADVGWLSARGPENIRAFRQGMHSDKPALGVLPAGRSLRQYQEVGANCALIVGSMQVAALAAQL